ncbi:Uncharacterised protein [uncultured archaeon]|nr:Uncharacterised protein [uncultured archaeon]
MPGFSCQEESNDKLRVMFDTNIYDLLAIEEGLTSKIVNCRKIVVYGCKPVRDELRETPAKKAVGTKSLRALLLNNYDLVIGKHNLIATELAGYLANEYLKQYNGNAPAKKIFKDFLIVAISSLKKLPVVCTNDEATMSSEEAVE